MSATDQTPPAPEVGDLNLDALFADVDAALAQAPTEEEVIVANVRHAYQRLGELDAAADKEYAPPAVARVAELEAELNGDKTIIELQRFIAEAERGMATRKKTIEKSGKVVTEGAFKTIEDAIATKKAALQTHIDTFRAPRATESVALKEKIGPVVKTIGEHQKTQADTYGGEKERQRAALLSVFVAPVKVQLKDAGVADDVQRGSYGEVEMQRVDRARFDRVAKEFGVTDRKEQEAIYVEIERVRNDGQSDARDEKVLAEDVPKWSGRILGELKKFDDGFMTEVVDIPIQMGRITKDLPKAFQTATEALAAIPAKIEAAKNAGGFSLSASTRKENKKTALRAVITEYNDAVQKLSNALELLDTLANNSRALEGKRCEWYMKKLYSNYYRDNRLKSDARTLPERFPFEGDDRVPFLNNRGYGVQIPANTQKRFDTAIDEVKQNFTEAYERESAALEKMYPQASSMLEDAKRQFAELNTATTNLEKTFENAAREIGMYVGHQGLDLNRIVRRKWEMDPNI